MYAYTRIRNVETSANAESKREITQIYTRARTTNMNVLVTAAETSPTSACKTVTVEVDGLSVLTPPSHTSLCMSDMHISCGVGGANMVAVTSSATDTPPSKRARRSILKVETDIKPETETLDPLLRRIVANLGPQTPQEYTSIVRAFYAGLEHGSLSQDSSKQFTFDESDSDGENNINGHCSLSLLAETVLTPVLAKKIKRPCHKFTPSPRRPGLLKRQLSEETFKIASLLGHMRYTPIAATKKRAPFRRNRKRRR